MQRDNDKVARVSNVYIHVRMVLNTYSPCVYSFSSQLGMHTKEVDVHLESNLNRISSEDFQCFIQHSINSYRF